MAASYLSLFFRFEYSAALYRTFHVSDRSRLAVTIIYEVKLWNLRCRNNPHLIRLSTRLLSKSQEISSPKVEEEANTKMRE